MDTYGTDKIRLGYLDVYHPILVPWLDKEIKLLELGVYHLYQGHSLELWRDYLPRATIVEIDLELPCGFVPGERMEVFQGMTPLTSANSLGQPSGTFSTIT